MAEKHTTRIDKLLWAVRIFKTRAIATEACTRGKVKIDSVVVKASRKIKIDNIVQVRKGVVKYMYKVRQISEKRMNAKLVPEFLEDITPEDELAKLKSAQRQPIQNRAKGQGRPTKRERRMMDKLKQKF